MNKVYLLLHSYYYGNNNEHEEVKVLGIYSTMQNAQDAILHYKRLPGFENFTDKCFSVDEYILNNNSNWIDGFIEL